MLGASPTFRKNVSAQPFKRSTAGAQGLSRGMAEGLLENGASVVLIDLQAEKLQQVVNGYQSMGYKAYGVSGDLSKKEELDRMFDESLMLLEGRLDVMIPAAGIQRRYEPWEFPEAAWKLVLDVNLTCMVYVPEGDSGDEG